MDFSGVNEGQHVHCEGNLWCSFSLLSHRLMLGQLLTAGEQQSLGDMPLLLLGRLTPKGTYTVSYTGEELSDLALPILPPESIVTVFPEQLAQLVLSDLSPPCNSRVYRVHANYPDKSVQPREIV